MVYITCGTFDLYGFHDTVWLVKWYVLFLLATVIEFYQGRIEPPKAERGHATSYSARIDGIVLSVTVVSR